MAVAVFLACEYATQRYNAFNALRGLLYYLSAAIIALLLNVVSLVLRLLLPQYRHDNGNVVA